MRASCEGFGTFTRIRWIPAPSDCVTLPVDRDNRDGGQGGWEIGERQKRPDCGGPHGNWVAVVVERAGVDKTRARQRVKEAPRLDRNHRKGTGTLYASSSRGENPRRAIREGR